MLSNTRRGSGVRFNRRDSKSREPLWLRGFESPPLRQATCLCLRRLTQFSGPEALPMPSVLLYIALPGDLKIRLFIGATLKPFSR
jgi:hypothetical protein